MAISVNLRGNQAEAAKYIGYAKQLNSLCRSQMILMGVDNYVKYYDFPEALTYIELQLNNWNDIQMDYITIICLVKYREGKEEKKQEILFIFLIRWDSDNGKYQTLTYDISINEQENKLELKQINKEKTVEGRVEGKLYSDNYYSFHGGLWVQADPTLKRYGVVVHRYRDVPYQNQGLWLANLASFDFKPSKYVMDKDGNSVLTELVETNNLTWNMLPKTLTPTVFKEVLLRMIKVNGSNKFFNVYLNVYKTESGSGDTESPYTVIACARHGWVKDKDGKLLLDNLIAVSKDRTGKSYLDDNDTDKTRLVSIIEDTFNPVHSLNTVKEYNLYSTQTNTLTGTVVTSGVTPIALIGDTMVYVISNSSTDTINSTSTSAFYFGDILLDTFSSSSSSSSVDSGGSGYYNYEYLSNAIWASSSDTNSFSLVDYDNYGNDILVMIINKQNSTTNISGTTSATNDNALGLGKGNLILGTTAITAVYKATATLTLYVYNKGTVIQIPLPVSVEQKTNNAVNQTITSYIENNMMKWRTTGPNSTESSVNGTLLFGSSIFIGGGYATYTYKIFNANNLDYISPGGGSGIKTDPSLLKNPGEYDNLNFVKRVVGVIDLKTNLHYSTDIIDSEVIQTDPNRTKFDITRDASIGIGIYTKSN